MGVQMWRRLGRAAAIAVLYGVTAGSTETSKGSSLSQPLPCLYFRSSCSSCPEHIPSSYSHSYGLAETCRGVLKDSQRWTQLLPLLSKECVLAPVPWHRHRNDGSWTRFLDCPPLVVSLPDHVFRVASPLRKQQKTDQIQLLLALLPMCPLVLNSIPVRSLQVWGCCCICREYAWPWSYGFFWSCTNV